MDGSYLALLAAVGIVSGFMAGFLGIGGGIIVIPAMVFVVGTSANVATGISVVEALFATISGLLVYRRQRSVNVRLGLALGLSGVVGALVGAFGSAQLTGQTILTLYLILVVIAFALLLIPRRPSRSEDDSVDLRMAIPIGLGVGVVSGLLGVGGGFLLMPLLISALRVPIRTAVGTALLVIIMTTFASATGKIATGQFDLQIGLPVVIGGVVGAQLGARVNARVSPGVVRVTLTLVLLAIIVRTGIDLFGR